MRADQRLFALHLHDLIYRIMLWLRFAMIQSDPAITSMTIKHRKRAPTPGEQVNSDAAEPVRANSPISTIC